MKLKQVHIFYHRGTDAIALVRQGVVPGDSEAVNATGEFVHALAMWAMAQATEEHTIGGKTLDRVLWWVKRKILRMRAPVLQVGRREFTDGRGNAYNVTVEFRPGPETAEPTETEKEDAE